MNRRTISWLILALPFFLVVESQDASAEGSNKQGQASTKGGILRVPLSGFKNDSGQVVVRLFRRGEDVPRGAGSRSQKTVIRRGQAQIEFTAMPAGEYALFAFHDENQNGTVDHNWLGLPKEALGFSNGFIVSLLTGIPDFDDLRIQFDGRSKIEAIVVR